MKKITLIFVLILSFFFININVNADGITGGYSGQGKGQGYKGGKRCDAAGCKCTGHCQNAQ